MTTAAHTDTQTPQGTRRVDELLAHYGESHQNPGNEVIHFIAIPLIMLSLVGMLFALHPWVAYAFVAASMVYYARLSVVFLITMAVLSVLAFAIVFAMGQHALAISVAIFVGAWIMQFIGHKMEGKKPSFFEDLQYLWVGPLFVLSKLFNRLGVRW
ncbi:MAG: DUF962 domain-containing protein [Polaromonas sp.]|uniref:Mpo1 family 2-hydroxy fatty acid dioxygenase n=1 Tax=Polaromonas sp. TaxID=1869339 RepID=UPI0025F7A3A4|nr:Mpo1-like protein [Polaromonas sp.]MBI2726152.1 DUF962 domain-containing protein [Polaromonas sp.]